MLVFDWLTFAKNIYTQKRNASGSIFRHSSISSKHTFGSSYKFMISGPFILKQHTSWSVSLVMLCITFGSSSYYTFGQISQNMVQVISGPILLKQHSSKFHGLYLSVIVFKVSGGGGTFYTKHHNSCTVESMQG